MEHWENTVAIIAHIRIRISFNEHDSVSVLNSQSRESADLFFEKKRCIFIC